MDLYTWSERVQNFNASLILATAAVAAFLMAADSMLAESPRSKGSYVVEIHDLAPAVYAARTREGDISDDLALSDALATQLTAYAPRAL